MLIMGLVTALNLAGHRLLGNRVQQSRSPCQQMRIHYDDAVQPFRNRPVDSAVLHAARQIHQIGHIRPRALPLSAGIQPAASYHRLQPFRLRMAQQGINQKRSMLVRPKDIDRHIIQHPSPVLRILVCYEPSRVSGRKIHIVQHPHAHIPFLRFLQDDIQVPPPSGPAEIRVGT